MSPGAEGGQGEVPGLDEVVNPVQGEEVNTEEDVVAGKGVEDAEDKAAVVEKVFFYLASGF